MVGHVSRIRVSGLIYDVQTETNSGCLKTIIFQSGTVVFVLEHEVDADTFDSAQRVIELQRDAISRFLKQK